MIRALRGQSAPDQGPGQSTATLDRGTWSGPGSDAARPDAAASTPDEGTDAAPDAVTTGPGALPPAPFEHLVVRAVAGDRGARERLLAQIYPLVLRYCRGRLGRKETIIGSAEDVAQDICLAVVAALPTYAPKGLSFRAFVYGIAAHKVTDAFRAIHRNRTEPVAEIPDAPVLREGPEQRMLAIELSERLGDLLHLLTPRQREVLVLRIAVGLSAEETAQIVGTSAGAVRVTQHRALGRLRTMVLGLPEGEEPADLGAVDDVDEPVE